MVDLGKRTAKPPPGGHRFNVVLGGRAYKVTSSLSHIDAAIMACNAQTDGFQIQPEAARVIDMYRNRQGLTYTQWGLIHFVANERRASLEANEKRTEQEAKAALEAQIAFKEQQDNEIETPDRNSGPHEFTVEINGHTVNFSSKLTHSDAINTALQITHQYMWKLPGEVTEIIKRAKRGYGLNYGQLGIMHYIASGRKDVIDTLTGRVRRRPGNISRNKLKEHKFATPPGVFRHCSQCGSIISGERLRLVPRASLCQACHNELPPE